MARGDLVQTLSSSANTFAKNRNAPGFDSRNFRYQTCYSNWALDLRPFSVITVSFGPTFSFPKEKVGYWTYFLTQ